ncbi:hypothetical protein PALB_11210 [Pseudoalteromonas luteoviolacea B = ATCC 29581]|nr:hypothetical protein PALB_11210 [Pseudoalteromonas luteoviolacea B = ATCC 29581]
MKKGKARLTENYVCIFNEIGLNHDLKKHKNNIYHGLN